MKTAGRSRLAPTYVAAALVVGMIVLSASCGGSGASSISPGVVALPTGVPQPPPEAQSSPPAEPDAGSLPSWAPPGREDHPEDFKGAAWFDDAVAAELAKDCHWDPGKCIDTISRNGNVYFDEHGEYANVPAACRDAVPMACIAIPDQACNPNPCSQDDACFSSCRATCVDCHGTCATRCDQCKAPCKDDACRLACGRECAVCHGRCINEIDHCTTAGCADWSKQCYRDQIASWNKSTCAKVCASVQKCVDRCPGADKSAHAFFEGACPQSCFTRLGKGCPAEFEANCMGDGSRYLQLIDPDDAPH